MVSFEICTDKKNKDKHSLTIFNVIKRVKNNFHFCSVQLNIQLLFYWFFNFQRLAKTFIYSTDLLIELTFKLKSSIFQIFEKIIVRGSWIIQNNGKLF